MHRLVRWLLGIPLGIGLVISLSMFRGGGTVCSQVQGALACKTDSGEIADWLPLLAGALITCLLLVLDRRISQKPPIITEAGRASQE